MVKGILLLDKPEGYSSFFIIPKLRYLLKEKKIGHAGTLDPFASGLMIYLIGKEFTRLADTFLHHDKVYECHFHLGIETDTYDLTGQTISQSSLVPSLQALEHALQSLSGQQLQVPPMFSAKKVEGKKLYDLARSGQSIERKACPVTIRIENILYQYPMVKLTVHCSKGTYIRSLAYDLGKRLGCGAHVSFLRRIASGPYAINQSYQFDHFKKLSAEDLNSINLIS